MFNKIRGWLFGKKEDKQEDNEEIANDLGVLKDSMTKEDLQAEKVLDKFDAEFHNPRLQCFYCGELIESGKIRFFKAPNQNETGAYHKRCFKKLKEGKLPGQ